MIKKRSSETTNQGFRRPFSIRHPSIQISASHPLFLKYRFLIPTSDAAAIKQRDADSKNIASPSENPASATFG
ncbi:hypothetical protein QP713_01685 [Neisseria mucosa]|uniref:Uncharacterized protein n=1 Tax=Neisseria mucosa TaxID=488 RepID=A0AAW6ZAV6_NEIMU|nr:hypothetical protein [Neisseria mucosa]MDK6725418.1 hypothetical protein [Neisseria mucosa]MDK6869851.1 hypothetical protein [Neisseria mucosa]MDK8109525.1 hypothetical protein [Neisseria mucosa]MDK8360809.1 hypothetical protein [Neisseria mucosa]